MDFRHPNSTYKAVSLSVHGSVGRIVCRGQKVTVETTVMHLCNLNQSQVVLRTMGKSQVSIQKMFLKLANRSLEISGQSHVIR